MQVDLDAYMAWYNNERTNQGKRCQGRTPKQTWDEGYELYKEYVIEGASAIGGPNREDRPTHQDTTGESSRLEDGGVSAQSTGTKKLEVTNDVVTN